MISLSPYSAEWPAISALLDEALDLSPSEHEAWLAGLDAATAVHRDALRALLRHRAQPIETHDFLVTGPRLDSVVDHRPSHGLAEGTSVGAYRLIAEIGRGGMATVWLAERTDQLTKRRVALKLPRSVWGDTFAERLAREREILASLEHPHIAHLYDAGIDAQGRPFLAMELVEGEPLDGYCRSRQLSVPERITLLLQVMAAVAHAHARLVVHRDLKPANILVTAGAQVKLLDFGIAKLLEGDHTARTALTEMTGRALTLDYASPEQIRGEALGTASDVYSLAVVAYETLAEARPYRLRRGSAAEMEEAIESAEPRPASEAAVTPGARKALRGDLDAILNRALKKSAAERYQSVDAFAQDLQRHLRGDPVHARPDSWRYRAGKFMRRRRLVLAMSGTLAVTVAIGLGGSLWQAREAGAQAARAEAEVVAQQAVRDLYIETMTDLSVAGANEPATLLKPHAVDVALQRKLAEMEPRFLDKPFGREAQLEAVMLQLNYDNDFEGSLVVGERYLAELKRNRREPHRIILAYVLLGRNLYQLKRYEQCESVRRAGSEWAPDAVDADTIMVRLELMADLGSVLVVSGKRKEAEQVLLRAEALDAAAFHGRRHHTEVPMKLSTLYLGFDEVKALRFAQQGHDGLLTSAAADPEQRSYDLLTLGTALMASGMQVQAEKALHEAHDISAQSNGRGHRAALRAFSRMIAAISRQGDYARADALLAEERRALTAMPAGLKPDAGVYLSAREIENAWLAGNTSAASSIAVPPPATLLDPRSITDNDLLLVSQARLLDLAGRPADGLSLLQALQRRWPGAGRPSASWIRLLDAMAGAELAAGKPADARQTANALRNLLVEQSASTGGAYRSALELSALASARLGDNTEAARVFAEAASSAAVFASPVERAESSLRRAEVLAALGRNVEAMATARAALGDLAGQHPDSPRVKQGRRLAGLDATGT